MVIVLKCPQIFLIFMTKPRFPILCRPALRTAGSRGSSSPLLPLYRLTRHLVKKSDAPGFITILYGSDVTEDQAQEAVQPLRDKFGDSCEISLVNGGQPVYYYIISVE